MAEPTAEPVRWEMPALDVRHKPPPSVAEIDAIEKAAREEGFARGHSEGYEKGMADARRIAQQLQGILESFARPLAQLDSEVQAAVGELAVRIAGALLGQAYQADPSHLQHLVEQSLAIMGSERRNVELRLHPNDIALLRTQLELPESVKLVPDNSLARGDLRCHADSLRIDATLGARLASALAALQPEAPQP